HHVMGIDLVRGELLSQPLCEVGPVEQVLRQQIQKQPPLQPQRAETAQSRFQAAALQRNTETGAAGGGNQGGGQLERALRAAPQRLISNRLRGRSVDDGLKKRVERLAHWPAGFAGDQPLNRIVHLSPRYAYDLRTAVNGSATPWRFHMKVFLQRH